MKDEDDTPASEEATHSPEGVDLTLIRWMLSLTPQERIEMLQNTVRSLLEMRAAVERQSK